MLEKTGLRPDAAARGRARDGARPARRRRRALLRRPARRRDGRASAPTSADVERGLDFGCSSGRVVRALAAAWPEAEWHGCDPNADAIAWAREHLPGIDVPRVAAGPAAALRRRRVRLRLRDLDLVALRRAGGAALARGDAPHRPPGRPPRAHHARPAVDRPLRAHRRALARRSSTQIRTAIYRTGFWFADEFGERGRLGRAPPAVGHGVLHARVAARARAARGGRSRTSRSARTPTTRTSTSCAAAGSATCRSAAAASSGRPTAARSARRARRPPRHGRQRRGSP